MATTTTVTGVSSRWRTITLIFAALGMCALVFNSIVLGGVSTTDTVLSVRVPAAEHSTHESRFVSELDLRHLSLLHTTCMDNREVILSWRFAADGEPNGDVLIGRDDPRVLQELRQCPDVDIYLPGSLRGNGYCEDGCGYVKYLNSRLLPVWVFEDHWFDAEQNRSVGYHELCPHTPLIVMNHYWDGRNDAPDWPQDKPLYVMPNIEMGQLQSADYWRADVILCKTRGCYARATAWYAQEGNPRNTTVFYTRHTTSDVASYITRELGAEYVRPKDFANIRFTHTAGSSVHKGTPGIVDCWLSRPDLPPLTLVINGDLYDGHYRGRYGKRLVAALNVDVIHTGLDELEFGKILAESSFFLCPSSMEGYGHYINQARASGGVIITTDAHPMNELIHAPEGGIYVKTHRKTHPHMILGGGFEGEHALRGFEHDGLIAEYDYKDLCATVDRVVAMSVHDRASMAERARLAYHEDTKFFAEAMLKLRAFARKH